MGRQRAVLARRGKLTQQGWFVEGDEQSNLSRRALIAHNITANLVANLIGGSFFAGLQILLKADDAFVGLVTMLTFGANLLQLFAPYVLERFEHRKPLLIGLRILAHAINIVLIGLIPFLPADQQAKLMLLGMAVLLVNALGAFIGPGFTVWHIAHIPPGVRVQYFSTVTMLNGVFIGAFNLLGSHVVDLFRQGAGELWGLTVLRVAALLIAVVDIVMLCRIKELPQKNPPHKLSLKYLLVKPWGQRVYLRSVLVVFLWSLVVNMPGSFYTIYLLRELQMSYFYIMLVNSLNVVVLVLLTPLWRRLFLKHSWLTPLSVAI